METEAATVHNCIGYRFEKNKVCCNVFERSLDRGTQACSSRVSLGRETRVFYPPSASLFIELHVTLERVLFISISLIRTMALRQWVTVLITALLVWAFQRSSSSMNCPKCPTGTGTATGGNDNDNSNSKSDASITLPSWESGLDSSPSERRPKRHPKCPAVTSVQANPSDRAKADDAFSSYRCLNEVRPPINTRCRFSNVCIRNDTSIFYYAGTNAVSEGTVPTFRKPLLYIDRDGDFPGNPKVIAGPPPEDAIWYPGVTVYMRSYMPVNFGHALDDNFFAAFRLLRFFELERDENVLYMFQDHRDCTQLAAIGFDKDDSHCEHLRELGSFFGRGSYDVVSPPKDYITNPSSKQPLFCARHLVAGTAKLGMWNDLELAHDAFVEDILCRMGLDPRPPLPQKTRIAIFEKRGRRRTLNSKEIADAVNKRFGVQADVVDIARLSFPEQVKLMQTYSGVISPSGGISFTAQFLPPGGGVVFTGAWDIKRNRTAEMDHHIFTTRLRVRDFYYPLSMDDLRLNDSLKRKEISEETLYRDFADIVVNVDRMTGVVEKMLRTLPGGFEG